MLGCIAVLEHGNEEPVIKAVNGARADHAAMLIRKSLFVRLHLSCMRQFDRVRPGDKHLRVAFQLLSDAEVASQVAPGHEQFLSEAQALFRAADDDPRRETLRHYRNKFLAHSSEPESRIALPIIRDLFDFASDTAKVAERLSFATGAVMIGLQEQAVVYRASAAAFWGTWRRSGDKVPGG